MKNKVQDKINHVRELAKTSAKQRRTHTGRNVHSDDSLSHVVRNSKEANIFLGELDSVIRISSRKK